MIISGLQTGDTAWLAAHLQNAADNEAIDVVEISGTVATDIDGALAEFDAIASGTRAREGVYAAFINPPEPLSRLQYARALALIEQRLGLEGQPRIVLFHEKKGREHCHVVWSRIDLERMRAIQLSFDRQKLRRCAQDLAAEFGLALPPGLAADRGAARFDDPPRPTRAEKAMEAASGLSRDERRALITRCYRQADGAQAFVHALEAAGFMLARGSKRVFVVVDKAGDVHALARQIDGAKTNDVKKKLEGLSLSLLPPAERARVLMLQRAAAQQDVLRAHTKKIDEAKAAHERLTQIQRKRRLEIAMLWQKMKVRHWHEWKVLLAHIKAETERRIARRHWLAAGLAAYLKKIAVIRQLLEYYEHKRKRSLEAFHRAMLEGLRRRHENEAADLKRRQAALDRLEAREWATLTRGFPGVFTDEARDGWRYNGHSHHRRIALSVDDVRFGFERPVEMTTLTDQQPAFRSGPGTRVTSTGFEGNFALPQTGLSLSGSPSVFAVGPGLQVPTQNIRFRANAAEITAPVPRMTPQSGNSRGVSFTIQRASVPLT